MLKPLIFDILGLTIGISVNIIHERIFRKSKDKLSSIMFTSFHPFYGLLIASVISINTNIFLFIMITFLSLMISKFFKSSNINIVDLIFKTNLPIYYLKPDFLAIKKTMLTKKYYKQFRDHYRIFIWTIKSENEILKYKRTYLDKISYICNIEK